MKIFIITQEESFYLPTFLQTVLAKRSQDIVGITILPLTMPKKGWVTTIHEHFQLYGLTTFLRQGTRFAYYRGLSTVERLIPLQRFYSVAAVARHYRLPVYPTARINSSSYLSALEGLEPDVILSINASQVFKYPLLEIPRLGCINVHGALLPQYRGRLPSFWTLLNGDEETGATVHYMNDRLDDGPIIAQRRVKIDPGETQDSLIAKTKRLGAELLIESLDRLEQGEVETVSNDRSQATYYSFPTPLDGQKFRHLGLRFL